MGFGEGKEPTVEKQVGRSWKGWLCSHKKRSGAEGVWMGVENGIPDSACAGEMLSMKCAHARQPIVFRAEKLRA